MGDQSGSSGRLKGRTILFVDTAADLATRYDRTVAAMAGMPELNDRYLVPEVRQDIEHYLASL